MVAPSPTTHWLPQDDLLLKNAVEAGASLEALAKGAVKFSQKFTLQEVRDRWHSLLYDVDVAIEASQRMIEAKVSGSSLRSKKNVANGSPGKRKSESVRQCYYARRKRIFNVPLESFDFDFLNDPISTNLFPGDELPNFEGIQKPKFGADNKSLGKPGNTEATFMTDGFSFQEGLDGACENVGLLDPVFGDKIMELPLDAVNQFQEQVRSGNFRNFASNCEQITRLSKSLFDYDEDDELLLNEAGDDETTDEWDSLLSFEEVPEIPSVVPSEKSPTMEKCCFENPTQICSAGSQEPLEGNPMHPELGNEVLCCTLNTEDTEIPENDDISLPIHAEMGSKIDDDLEDFSSGSDGEVPYFSDVEEMINDMDLCPGDDVDVHRNLTVLKYQANGARERIIRMEQAAKAATDRYIAAHGAYAILYGRHSKYFIKKPEVVIGRGTEDVQVDICLGKESCAAKISRRQATLKLDNDGTFHLCNHGKFPIFVNGKKISLGQTSSLIPGCLIEIRELAFLFETNEKSCKAVAAQVH